MGIENELVEFLKNNIKDSSNKARDIEVIKFYYGLNESPWPTLEDTANRYNVGSRERVRQLLNFKFRNLVTRSDIPSISGFLEILNSKSYWIFSDFEVIVHAGGFINKDTHLKGIFNLVEDIGIATGYEIFTPDLKRTTRNSLCSCKNTFLIREANVKGIEKLLRMAQGLPGRCGVANLRYIEDSLGEHYGLISALIESSTTSWVMIDGDDYWYVFENRDNTIINYSEKVFLLIEQCDSTRLAVAYRNALDGRTYQYPYPPAEIIEQYLKSSVFFLNFYGSLKFIGETTRLNTIEEDLISFFDVNTMATFPQLDEYLTQKGYGRPHILKNTNFSPLVFVDKSQGRRHYVYSLIGQSKQLLKVRDDFNHYESYLVRLRSLLDIGTDESREQIARKEQYILQEWLFKGKSHENCAICGREFDVKTLVAAHKKPRVDCNDAERLDPYIVMPLCLMGCDYLYEHMYIYIDGNEVKRGMEFSSAKTEAKFIEENIGRKINSKWLLGNKSYFRSPYKKLHRSVALT